MDSNRYRLGRGGGGGGGGCRVRQKLLSQVWRILCELLPECRCTLRSVMYNTAINFNSDLITISAGLQILVNVVFNYQKVLINMSLHLSSAWQQQVCGIQSVSPNCCIMWSCSHAHGQMSGHVCTISLWFWLTYICTGISFQYAGQFKIWRDLSVILGNCIR